jgi:hypothetical protein
VSLFHRFDENTSFVEQILNLYYHHINQPEEEKNMKKILTKDTLQKIKQTLSRTYMAYMMDKNLPTIKVGDIRRINWSGCEL